jgi:hypothetical protein
MEKTMSGPYLSDLTKGNGAAGELPPDRVKAVEYGLTQFQQIAHERDELRKENAGLRNDLVALRIENDGLITQLTDALSHVKSMMLVRDEALAHRIKYEALFISLQSQMRAFAIPVEPLIKGHEE